MRKNTFTPRESASAGLFTWLQQADFYVSLHKEAVKKLPQGEDKTWVDVGCGPGLLTRLAAARGYKSIGIDADKAMIASAIKLAKSEHSSAVFMIGTVKNFRSMVPPADVVSAASLLAVLDDKRAGVISLWDAVKSGGLLLIIEPTEKMTHRSAEDLIKSGFVIGEERSALRLWARARDGHAVDARIYNGLDHVAERHFFPLLHGLVGAWLIRKSDEMS